jgi:hypothetical protein
MRNALLVLVTLNLLAAHPSKADDLFPPAYRGGPLSTAAEWDFLTDQSPIPILPDGDSVNLVVGDSAPLLDSAFPTGAPHPSGSTGGDVSWSSNSNGGYRGGMAGDGLIVFNVPNWIDTEPSKLLRIQVTYTGPSPTTLVIGFMGVPGSSSGVTAFRTSRVDVATHQSLPAGMSYFYEDWQILPNPDWEQVVLFLPHTTFVDQVVIDTISGSAFDPSILFLNGFESGDTNLWSQTVP